MNTPFLSHEDAARRNRNNVLHYIKKNAPLFRTDIWKPLHISRSAASQIIRQLQEDNLVLETGEGESTGGRRPQYLVFNGMSKKLYAFDWTSLTLFLMSLGSDVLYEKKVEFPPLVAPEVFAETLCREIALIESLHLCSAEDMIGFCIALPGLIDPRNGVVIHSVELGWQNVSVNSLFQHHFSANIYLEQTLNLMALGEHAREQYKASAHFQLFMLGTSGIGVSSVIHNHCQHGANCMHGELGHIKMPVDIACYCGQTGCLEAVVKDLILRNGGKADNEVLEYLAVGVSTVINLFDTNTAALMGSYVDDMTSEQKNILLEKILSKLISRNFRKIDIYFSGESKQMLLTGIGSYVFDRYFLID